MVPGECETAGPPCHRQTRQQLEYQLDSPASDFRRESECIGRLRTSAVLAADAKGAHTPISTVNRVSDWHCSPGSGVCVTSTARQAGFGRFRLSKRSSCSGVILLVPLRVRSPICAVESPPLRLRTQVTYLRSSGAGSVKHVNLFDRHSCRA